MVTSARQLRLAGLLRGEELRGVSLLVPCTGQLPLGVGVGKVGHTVVPHALRVLAHLLHEGWGPRVSRVRRPGPGRGIFPSRQGTSDRFAARGRRRGIRRWPRGRETWAPRCPACTARTGGPLPPPPSSSSHHCRHPCRTRPTRIAQPTRVPRPAARSTSPGPMDASYRPAVVVLRLWWFVFLAWGLCYAGRH